MPKEKHDKVITVGDDVDVRCKITAIDAVQGTVDLTTVTASALGGGTQNPRAPVMTFLSVPFGAIAKP